MSTNPPFKAGERVGAIYWNTNGGMTFAPGILLAVCQSDSGTWYGTIRMQHADVKKLLHPNYVDKVSELLPSVRREWTPIWERLESPDWNPDWNPYDQDATTDNAGK